MLEKIIQFYSDYKANLVACVSLAIVMAVLSAIFAYTAGPKSFEAITCYFLTVDFVLAASYFKIIEDLKVLKR